MEGVIIADTSRRYSDILISHANEKTVSDERTALLVYDSKVITISYKSIDVRHDDEIRERNGTIFSSVFSLVSTMIGGGLLSLPFAFEQGGLAVSSVILFITLMTSTYGAFLLINCRKYCSGHVENVEDVAKTAFGRKGEIFVQVLLVLLLYLSSVAYFILISEQMAPIISLLFRNSTFWIKKETLLAIVFVIVFPISLRKNLSSLRFTSGLSVVCGIFLCICVTYRCSTSGFGGPIKNRHNPVRWYPRTIGGFITSVSIAEVGYSCHFNVLPMYNELAHQTRKNKRIILFIAMGITYAMNSVVSTFGYLEFRKYTDQDITENYLRYDNVVTFGRVAFCCVLLLSYPLLIVPCRSTINKMVWSGVTDGTSKLLPHISDKEMSGPNNLCWVVETVFIVGTSYLLAYVVPHVNMVWGVVGAVGCTLLIYVLPAAFYIRLRSRNEKVRLKMILPSLLLVVGFLMLLVGMYQAVLNIALPVTTPSKRLHSYNSSRQ